MSGLEGTQARRPLRTAGLALLGLAAAAALTGLLVIPTGDEETSAGERPASPGLPPENPATVLPPPDSSPTPPPSAAPTPPPSAPEATAGPPEATAAPAPGAVPETSGPPATPAPVDSDVETSGKGIGRGQVRVYNNGTVHGLAARAADDLRAEGWTVVEVANYSAGRIATTTVYYQENTGQRAIAEEIGAEFGMRVEPRFSGIAQASPGVIVIVTNDYRS